MKSKKPSKETAVPHYAKAYKGHSGVIRPEQRNLVTSLHRSLLLKVFEKLPNPIYSLGQINFR